MKSLIFIGLLTCSLAGCQTFQDIAKTVALEVIEKEKPRIREAIVEARNTAINSAKVILAEKMEEKSKDWSETAAMLQSKPDKTLSEQIQYMLYLAGGGTLAQVAQFMVTSASEKRKKERDLIHEVKKT